MGSYLHCGETSFNLICQIIVVRLLTELEMEAELNLGFSPQVFLKCFCEIVVDWQSCVSQSFISGRVKKFCLIGSLTSKIFVLCSYFCSIFFLDPYLKS